MRHRSLSYIASDIYGAWKTPYFGAVPYLRAMSTLDQVTENYGHDSAREIVIYFLANAGSFRGPKARELKAELKAIAGIK
jgi:hypothetical protein